MKFIFGIITIFVFINFLQIYGAEYRRQYSSSYESKPQQLCCTGGIVLSSWALSHYKDVRNIANIMRQQYFILSQNGQQHSVISYKVPAYGTRSEEEMANLIREHVEYIINEINSGRISQTHVSQTNFFEQEAATILKRIEQEQNVIVNKGPNMEHVETINSLGNVQHFTFPSEVHMIGDKTYVMKKNCTTSTTNNIAPTTILESNIKEIYNETHTGNIHHIPMKSPFLDQTSSSHSIYNYLNRHESQVPNWSPQVIINEETNSKYLRKNTPAVVIPIPSNLEEVETFNQENHNRNINFPSHFFDIDSNINIETDESRRHINNRHHNNDHSTVTIKHYNRTVITGTDGRPIIEGGESETIINNGQIIFNKYRPFGSSIHEEEWKKLERENLFWLFYYKSITNDELQRWQFQQEERLHDLAYRYNTTIEQIEKWQREELEIFKKFANEQMLMLGNLEEWQKNEMIRLSWLIQQNALTQKEFEFWQRQNRNALNSLANEYQISLLQFKEWQNNQFEQIIQNYNFHNRQFDALKDWQNQERDRLYSVIRQHNITVEELHEQIKRDQERLENISQQYHLNIAEMEKWLKSELNRLTLIINEQQEEIKRLTEWQRQERYRLEQITKEHNLTVEELTLQLKHDRNYLNNLAHKYHISIEELEAWQRKEIDRLKNIGIINIENELKEWQQRERARLMAIAQQNDYTIEEFEKKIKEDRMKLQILAEQYQVRVEEIEEWIKKESNRLYAEGILKNVERELNEWQQRERDRLLMIIKQNEISVDELEKRIKMDNQHLYDIAIKYQIQVRDIEKWLQMEIERLQAEGWIRIGKLEEWQKSERRRLNEFILQNQLTIEDFEQLVLHDRSRLQSLALLYHVQIEELERFIKIEIERMRLEAANLSKFQKWQIDERSRLMQIVLENQYTLEEFKRRTLEDREFLQILANQYQINIIEIEKFILAEINRLNSLGFIIIRENEELTTWQKFERDNLMALVRQYNYTDTELLQKIKSDRYRLEKIAYDYKISVEEIIEWFRHEISELLKRGLIYESERLFEWQKKEREYLQKIITQQKWTFEELQRKLTFDQERLKSLALQYHITIQRLIEWYDSELFRLLNNGEIFLDTLKQWKKVEQDRLYRIVTSQSYTIEELKIILWQNEENLRILSQNYQITIRELKQFQKEELERLLRLGLIYNGKKSDSLLNWQIEERNRLNLIVKEFKISEEELIEFLRSDRDVNSKLIIRYGISIETLETWQLNEVKLLRNEGKLDNRELINLEYWQKRERDRLYILILTQTFTETELIEWQSDLENLQKIADQYHIHVEELRQWQLKELNRLYMLAQHYQMSIKELAQFRLAELERLQTLSRSFEISKENFEIWRQQQNKRFSRLVELYKISWRYLENWRRILFLHCQGLIGSDFEIETSTPRGNYNETATPKSTINRNRGDQPPNTFIEDYDEDEPNIYGNKPTTGPIQEREPTTYRPTYNIPPSGNLQMPPVVRGGSTDTYGRTYRKKVTTYTGPVVSYSDQTDIATGSNYNYNLPATRNLRYNRSTAPYNENRNYELDNNFNNDDGQQKLMNENLEDFYQQHLVETNVQKELLVNNDYGTNLESNRSTSQNYVENNEKNVESVIATQQVEEEPTSIWGKVKKKTKDIFG